MNKIYSSIIIGVALFFSGFLLVNNANATVVQNCGSTCPVVHYEWTTTEVNVAEHYDYANKESVIDVAEHYSCSDFPGYNLVGNKCKKHDKSDKNAVLVPATYKLVCPSGYSNNPGRDNCRKLVRATYKTTNHSADVEYNKSNDPNKCHRPSDSTLSSVYGMNTSAVSDFKQHNSEWKDSTLFAPEGYYLSDGACYPKTPVCTDSKALNYDSSLSDREISDNKVCTYTEAGTCPTTCGYAGSNDSISDGKGGFLTCPSTDECTVPVNGGWTNWSPLTCPTAPGTPESTQTRTCTNPAPANGGSDCEGPISQICNAVPECNENILQTIVSDASTLQGTNPTVFVSPLNSGWTASIPDAFWIWGENPISDAINQTSETFTRTFTVDGAPTGATLDIAADNSYEVSLNGNAVGSDSTEFNYQSSGQDSYTIPLSSMTTGSNTITFKVTNWGLENGTADLNPAGLLYKLKVNSNNCQPPVLGCMDPLASNYNQNATKDDQSCVYPPTTGSLTICKYSDKGTIGQYEEGTDTPLAWDMTVTYPNDGGITNYATNSESGCVTIDSLPFGSYSVSEASKTNWTRTYPEGNPQSTNINIENQNPKVYFLNQETNMCIDNNEVIDSVLPESLSTWKVNNTGGNPIFSYSEIVSPDDESTAIRTSVVGDTVMSCPSQSIEKKYSISGNTDTTDLQAYLAFTSTMDEYNFPYVVVQLFDNSDNQVGYQVYYGNGVISGIYAGYASSDPTHYTELPVSSGDVTLDLSRMGSDINFSSIKIFLSNYACVGQNSIVFDNLRLVSQCTEPVDVCPNIEGTQENIPKGKVKIEGQCVPIAECSDNEKLDEERNICVPIVGVILGCIDRSATNYSQYATKNDGSCKYPSNGGNGPVNFGFVNNGGGNGPIVAPQPRGEVLGVSCGVYMEKFIRLGSAKNDSEQVKKLQEFLNKHMGASLPVTGFYGPMTFGKLKDFQSKYSDEVLKPWNLDTPTGLVYLSTLRQINNIECPDIAGSLPELVPWSLYPNVQS